MLLKELYPITITTYELKDKEITKFFEEIINSDFDFSQHIDDFVNFHSERTEY